MHEIFEANKLLKNKGGRGDETVARVGGRVLTVQESVTVRIARDACDDAVRRQYPRRPLHEIPLIDILKGLDERVKNRFTTAEEVGAEIGRIYNSSRRNAGK